MLERLGVGGPPAAGDHVTVVGAEQDGRTEADVDVVGLHRIDLPLDAEDGLIELELVGVDPVGRRHVRVIGSELMLPEALSQP